MSLFYLLVLPGGAASMKCLGFERCTRLISTTLTRVWMVAFQSFTPDWYVLEIFPLVEPYLWVLIMDIVFASQVSGCTSQNGPNLAWIPGKLNHASCRLCWLNTLIAFKDFAGLQTEVLYLSTGWVRERQPQCELPLSTLVMRSSLSWRDQPL